MLYINTCCIYEETSFGEFVGHRVSGQSHAFGLFILCWLALLTTTETVDCAMLDTFHDAAFSVVSPGVPTVPSEPHSR